MKIFVISLISSEKRRKRVVEQLSSQSINFEFIDAIDGRVPDFIAPAIFNSEKFIEYRGRSVEKGEIGCYLSHMLAWQKAVDFNEPCLIFEDDFILSSDFSETLPIFKQWSLEYGFLRLEPWGTRCCYKVANIQQFSVNKFLKIPQCLTGYIISPSCAATFIKESQKEMFLPVDVFIRHSYLHKQAIYGISPALVEPTEGTDTIIGERDNKIRTVKVKLQKLKNRIYSACRSAFCNLFSK